jgi:hypothetical protein
MELFGSVSRRLAAGLILSVALCAFAYADDLDGTWRLVMRKLPDGTVQTPPTVQGMGTTKNGVNQLIVFWPTPDGKPASISQISKWEWFDTEVAATPVLVIFDDGSGKPPVYAVGGETKRVPFTKQGGRVSYQHPINAPFIVYEGDKLTATLEGVFVDYWERVK